MRRCAKRGRCIRPRAPVGRRFESSCVRATFRPGKNCRTSSTWPCTLAAARRSFRHAVTAAISTCFCLTAPPSRVPGGRDVWSSPLPLDGLNSEADDVFPQWQGQDISFGSNRSGTFQLFQARAALQYLRAEPHPLEVAGEVLSAVTVGPGFTWVARRLSEDQAVEVVRVSWPQPERPLPEGWSCVHGWDSGAM